MLTELCQYLRNWFELSKHNGDFTIKNGVIGFSNGKPLPLLNNQYFRVIGSVFNDGVYQYGVEVLVDEQFVGSVWAMAVPPAVIAISHEIEDWIKDNATVINSPFLSESFAGYSYTKGNNYGSGSSSSPITWMSQFASRLNQYRKVSAL